MKTQEVICYSLIFIIFIILVYINYNKISYYKNTEDISKPREDISDYYFNNKFTTCNDIPTSDSFGLLVDASIVCDATKDLPTTPSFYFEKAPEDFDNNGWLFVNLDITDFETFQEKTPINIMCKTYQAYYILKSKFPSKNVIYTGFSSLDKYIPSIQKNYRKYLHLAGKSPYKGTTNVIKAWKSHPEWPELILICRINIEGLNEIKNYKNIKVLDKYLPENELVEIMNRCGVHVCSSYHEGFGHYINEAKSVKSVVLYTNAPSMNEFFNNQIGIPINTSYVEIINNICPKYTTSPTDIEEAVEITLEMTIRDMEEMGERTRLDFLYNDTNFKTRIKELIYNNYPE